MNEICLTNFDDAHILVVDDDHSVREFLFNAVTSFGLKCSVAIDGETAIDILECQDMDVVITDINMPRMNGIELAKTVKKRFSSSVIVITGHITEFSYEGIIDAGADDFVTKPFSLREMALRIKRILKERCLLAEAVRAHEELKATYKDLQDSYMDTIHRLVMAAEYKDESTGDHIVRIGRYCALLTKKLGLAEKDQKNIQYAAPMHDIGKIGIPDRILTKPSNLSDDEYEAMKMHTTIGARLLSKSKSEVLQIAQQIAVSHHEKWDGTGYPQGLMGKRIPLVGRIVAISDTFDALISKRPYKDAYPAEVAFDIIKIEKGTHFDPQIVDLFLENSAEILRIREELGVPDQAAEVCETDRSAPECFVLSRRDYELKNPITD